LFLIAALIGFFVSEMDTVSLGQQDNGILFGLISLEQGQDLLSGFVIIFFMTLIVAIFSGATDIPKDIESRMIMLVLSKPIKRIEYLLGKYLGIIAICFVFFLTAACTAAVTHFIKTGNMFPFAVLGRQFLLLFALFPFVAVTIMISTFLSDISAMIIAIVYLTFSMLISALSIFVDMLPKSLEIISVIHVIAYFFPNFFFFFNSFKLPGVVLFALVTYSISLSVIFLVIAGFRMNIRDLK